MFIIGTIQEARTKTANLRWSSIFTDIGKVGTSLFQNKLIISASPPSVHVWSS